MSIWPIKGKNIETIEEAMRRDGYPDIEGVSYVALWSIDPELMGYIDRSFVRAQHFLNKADWRTCRSVTLSAISAAYGLISDTASNDAIRILGDLAKHLEGFVEYRAERAARRNVAKGLAKVCSFSLLFLSIFALAVVAIGRSTGIEPFVGMDLFVLRDSVVCIGGGAAGAATSVLIRLRRANQAGYESFDSGVAVYRVILGWFFAAAVLFLVKGNVVNLVKDPTVDALTANGTDRSQILIASGFFWTGAGFLAGFNERWVGNIFSHDDEEDGSIDTGREHSAVSVDSPNQLVSDKRGAPTPRSKDQ